MSPLHALLPPVLAKPLRWPTDSARRARDNAATAAAALAARRAEREDVDRFLLEHGASVPLPAGRPDLERRPSEPAVVSR